MKKEMFLVGGAVRDMLAGLPLKDYDFVVVGYNRDSLKEEFPELKQVGKSFPVFLTPEGHEVALARKEVSTGGGHTDFTVDTENITIEEDLMRRDLTINAMAVNEEGTLIDPFNGKADLENKILRHTSDALFDDPLRVLRLARFQTKFPKFRIHETTLKLIRDNKEKLRDTLTPERVRMEMMKAMEYPNPSMYFRTLDFLGVLFMHPELEAMKTCIQKPQHHAEGDVFLHSMMVLDEAAKLTTDVTTRLAALYHDIAKPASDPLRQGYHNGHDGLELVSVEVDKLKHSLKLTNKEYKAIIHAALYHMKLHKLHKMKSKTIASMINESTFPRDDIGIRRLVLVATADARGRITIGYKKPEIDYQCLINAVEAIENHSLKEFIDDNPDAKVEHIKNVKHAASIGFVEAFVRPVIPYQGE